MNELFLFVRPPRPLWPFNGPASAFWPPLAFASLAAALRAAVGNLRVGILDAPIKKMGWRSVEQELVRQRPAYVGIGEEAVSCAEGLRLASLAKQAGAKVIAGGCFFGHLAPEVLATGLVDVVVHGEGEQTIVELVEALRTGREDDLEGVAGISFAADRQAVFTGRRQPMDDLDRLPLPAYDLLPTEHYGRGSRNHPDFAAIELSRGCSRACDFCVLWRQMGRFHGSTPVPCLRAKSPERVLEEVEILVKRYGRRYLGWVDPCFNAHPTVPGRVAQLLLGRNLRVGQSAWARADDLVRDADSGALAKCVAAGLNEVYVGVERPDQQGLASLHKQTSLETVRHAFRILGERHPEVFRVGSFIYGLPGDSPATVRAIHRLAHELDLDMTFYIPLTPLPGTVYWSAAYWDPSGQALRALDFLPRIDGDPAIASLTWSLYLCLALRWPWRRVRWLLSGLFSPHARRRSIIRRHALRGLRLFAVGMAQALFRGATTSPMRVPEWYDT
jgi:anaerobic magnesium-protoporphyrin IX monomethyl ester cyclase